MRSALVMLVAVLATAVPAVSQSPLGEPAPYRIGSQDRIAVRVHEQPDLDVERRVDAEGKIRMPVIGELMAAGKSESELAAEIKEILESRYLRQASVEVEVVEFRAQSVSVLGAVGSPGSYGFGGDWTLLDALTAAGGLTAEGSATVNLLRRASNGLTDQISFPSDDLTGGEVAMLGLPVFAGDLINVETRPPVKIFVLGEAQTKGAMEFGSGERVTLLYAVARMGGLPERASSKIVIRRRDEQGRVVEIPVNFKRVLAGHDPDVELKDGDILVVKDSFF